MLQLLIVVPDMFPSKTRLTDAHGGDADLNASTHKNTAYKKLVEALEVDYEPEDGSDRNFVGQPQLVKVPVDCEEDIEWEIQFYSNDEDELTDQLGGVQFFSILSVDLTAIAKPKARAQGRARVIGAVPMQAQAGNGNGNGNGN